MDPVVILSADSVPVEPGQEARLPVRIRNQGRRVESYHVDVVGAAASFAQVDPPTVSVLPGREAEVAVTFRPPPGASTPTGRVVFAVRARSEVDQSASAAAEGALELAGVSALQAWAPDTARAGRWSATYDVEFANRGNEAVRLAVNAHDPAAALQLKLTPDVVDLPAGGRMSSTLKATARRPFLRGTAKNHQVQVTCQSFPFGAERPVPGSAPPPDDPNHHAFQLTFEQKPILTKLAMVAIVLLVVLAVGLFVLRYRGGDDYALGLATPVTPTDVSAEALGPTSVSLSWEAVPNAATYTLRINNVDAGEVEPPPANRRVTHTVADLEPATEYCFTVTAVGPPDAEPPQSVPSSEVCTTTDAESALPAPMGLTVERVGVDQYSVAWEFPGGEDGVTFVVLVDNAPEVSDVADSPTTIEITAEAEPREVLIAVRAVRGDQRSDPSEAVALAIPARVVDTVPTTPPPPPTTVSTDTPGTEPSATTTPGGGATTVPETTAVPVTTPVTTVVTTPSETTAPPPTTPPPPAAPELTDVAPTPAAMLGQWTPPAAGGVPLDERKARLAGVFGVPVEQMDVFSNRDTLVAGVDGEPHDLIAGAPPGSVFIYTPVPNEQDAELICDEDPIACDVVVVQGAAQAAVGSPVLVLATFPGTELISTVDDAIADRREQVVSHPVHVLDGSLFQDLPAGQVVIYASGFTDAGQATAVCTGLPPGTCQSVIPELRRR